MFILRFCQLVFILVVKFVYCDDISIEIAQGKLVGQWKESLNGRKYGSFEGIPYAKPPVRKYRFEEPIPANAWYGIWQAKTFPNLCLQWFDLSGNEQKSLIGDEDCLYVNVYSPEPYSIKKLPVLVYIHGGSFLHGSGAHYGPRFMMDHDIVYVSINYRVGPLGFLTTLDEHIPGNNGLKDQYLALKWVKNNVRHFGGDPDQVTIMGLSAGGASVHYHMLSKKSRALFHRAISQSGTSLCPWSQQVNPKEKALRMAAFLGCPINDTETMVKCMKLRPASSIIRAVQSEFMVMDHSPLSPFAPVIEPKSSKNAFLTEHPYKIIKDGGIYDVPWMTSTVTQEGLYPVAVYMINHINLGKINLKWNELAPHMYGFNETLPLKLHTKAAMKIRKHYLKERQITSYTVSSLVDSLSDRHFVVCMEKTVRLQAVRSKQPIYVYVFAYSGKTSVGMTLSQSQFCYGVSHGDDTGYSLDTPYMDPTTCDADKEMVAYKTNLIASFVITGKPDAGKVEWTPVDMEENKINYLNINSPEDVTMESRESLGDCKFWDSLGIVENEALFPHDEL